MKKMIVSLALVTLSVSTFAIDGKYSGKFEELNWGKESGSCSVVIKTKDNGETKVTLNLEGSKYNLQKMASVKEENGIKTYTLSQKDGGNPEISDLCDYMDICSSKERNEIVTLQVQSGKLTSASLSIWPFGNFYECLI
ncbi:MAG: hypothetical protein HON90_05550 [Halobacteriovoraceae bacterium]|jgi:hypothetical protein|nr:hypothetical protein [Halobacteriovoraceae bacterium]